MEERGEQIPEGLEIVSIGSLYAGPSEKKYWSSSRGKDRYPYPVGYNALRTYAGITYKMEIQEGVKGPLFVVTSPCGDSFSGRTPDVSWEYFWKKNGPKVRNWNGKRFCGKIDGIEFFGFRNPFVQRLLRELVASVQGVAEISAISLENEVPDSEIHAPADLLLYLGKGHGPRKRSKRSNHKCSEAYTFLKQDLNHSPKQGGKLYLEIETSGQHELQEGHNSILQSNDLFSKPSKTDPAYMSFAVPNEMLGGFLDSTTEMRELTEDAKTHAQLEMNLNIADSFDTIQDEVDAFAPKKGNDQIIGCNQDEVARSMMALLLPSAVPLLSKSCKRRTQKNDRKSKSPIRGSLAESGVSGEQVTSFINSGGAQVIVPDSLEDDLYAHDVDEQKPILDINCKHPTNDKKNDKTGWPCDFNPHKDQQLDDSSSSSSCLLRRADDNCAEKNGDILESTHSSTIFPRNFPLEPEVISEVVEESLPASQQDIGNVRKRKTEYFAEENYASDYSLQINGRGAHTSSTADARAIISSIGKISAEITKDSCPLVETSNPLLLTGQPCTVSRTTEEPSFNVPFSESIILRDINLSHGNIYSDDQCHDQTTVLQDPKAKSDKVNIEATCSPESMKCDENFEESAELFGCYLHPFSILSVQLKVSEDKIYICTFCGPVEGVDGFLFLYQIPVIRNITRPSCPSFLGYTSIVFSKLGNTDSQRIPVERCGFQLTPDGGLLILSNFVKAPSCREMNIGCNCFDCKSDELTSVNAIKIVHLELGFASTVAELRTAQNIHFILVCETSHLLGIEESGNLCVWQMDSSWRSTQEEFILPGFDFLAPSSAELKHIPKCDSLVLGHNGAGYFCLWDISARVAVSKFSTTGKMLSGLLPLGYFYTQVSSLIGPSPKKCEPSSLWLLIKEESSMMWRLSLVVNDSLLLGRVLDSRGCSVGALNDLGIMGTSDSCVYIWELTSGRKLVELHPFTGGRGATSVVADEKSGMFVVVGDGCELRIYLLSKITR